MNEENNIWSKYDSLHPLILKSLIKSGFEKPTEVQSHTLEDYKHYNNFIIASMTGSGKTLAFGLPILSDLLYNLENQEDLLYPPYIKCLILTPTRELALQIQKHLEIILNNCDFDTPKKKKLKKKRAQTFDSNVNPIVSAEINLESNIKTKTKKTKVIKLEETLPDSQPTKITSKNPKKSSDVQNSESVLNDPPLKKNCPIRTACLVGGMSKEKQERLISYMPQILIATPGRLWEFIDGGNLQMMTIKNIDFLILDEADRMIELGHFEELNKIFDFIFLKKEQVNQEEEKLKRASKNNDFSVENIDDDFLNNIGLEEPTLLPVDYYYDIEKRSLRRKEKPLQDEQKSKTFKEFALTEETTHETLDFSLKSRKRKIFLVSATLTKFFRSSRSVQLKNHDILKRNRRLKKNPRERDTPLENPKLNSLIEKIKFSSKPKIIDLAQFTLMPTRIQKFHTFCSEEEKVFYLYLFLKSHENENFIIFNNSINSARKITNFLNVLNFECVSLHSQLQQKQRIMKLEQFETNLKNVIVCTDVAARGIDVPEVKNVIHFQIPKDGDTFVHRSGRTGRIGREGKVYSIVDPDDMKRYKEILKDLGEDSQIEILAPTINKQTRSIVESAIKTEGLSHQINKKKRAKLWFEKNSKIAEIKLDDEIDAEIKKIEEQSTKKKKIFLEEKKKNHHPQFQKKRNSVYIDPSQIHLLIQKMNQK